MVTKNWRIRYVKQREKRKQKEHSRFSRSAKRKKSEKNIPDLETAKLKLTWRIR